MRPHFRSRLFFSITALLALWAGAALFAPSPAPAQEGAAKPRVAVLEFEGVEVSAAEAAAVTDQMRTDLVNLGVFTVLDRAQTERVLEELAFQQQGVTDPDRAVRIGQMLNVELIVTGRVAALEGAYQVNVQMIRVQTGEIERSESILYRGDILGLLSENIATIASRLGQVEGYRPPARVAGEPPEEPAAEPAAPAAEKPGWPLWTGVGLLAAATYFQLDAMALNDDAESKAADSRTLNDPALYAEAESLRGDAEDQARNALIVGAAGAGLLVYYWMMEPAPPEAAGLAQPAPPLVLGPRRDGGLRVGWRWRW